MKKEALVVERNVLFQNNEFQGFKSSDEIDFISLILENHFYCERGEELEFNESLKQIIPYVWVLNIKTRKVFLYKRGINQNKKDGEYVEKRYQNNYSGGVGGHIDRDTEEGSENPIENAMIRELKEEVVMESYPSPRIVGYLNDNENSIGKVHLGIVAIAETIENVQSRASEGLKDGKFYSIDEVEEIFANQENEIENWTKLSWPFVKDYLNKI